VRECEALLVCCAGMLVQAAAVSENYGKVQNASVYACLRVEHGLVWYNYGPNWANAHCGNARSWVVGLGDGLSWATAPLAYMGCACSLAILYSAHVCNLCMYGVLSERFFHNAECLLPLWVVECWGRA
jgi:hypothetical protein